MMMMMRFVVFLIINIDVKIIYLCYNLLMLHDFFFSKQMSNAILYWLIFLYIIRKSIFGT